MHVYIPSAIIIIISMPDVLTFWLMISFVARHRRHLRSENPTDSLNPPCDDLACINLDQLNHIIKPHPHGS